MARRNKLGAQGYSAPIQFCDENFVSNDLVFVVVNGLEFHGGLGTVKNIHVLVLEGESLAKADACVYDCRQCGTGRRGLVGHQDELGAVIRVNLDVCEASSYCLRAGQDGGLAGYDVCSGMGCGVATGRASYRYT